MPRVPFKQFLRDLKSEIKDDNVSNGAAALAYYLTLSIFPAMIFLLTLLPYLPIPNIEATLMQMIREAMPGDAATMFEGVIRDVTTKRGGLLSFGLLLTIWAASNGFYALMQQLNITYDVKEGRPFWKARGTAILLTFLFLALLVSACALIVAGGAIQGWLSENLGFAAPLLFLFSAFRWLVIGAMLMLALALIFYFGPDVEQDFKFVTPGSVLGTILLVAVSMLFRLYVTSFGNYSATYGAIGAVVVMMAWLYLAGITILLGSEINALYEHYSPDGKNKGEKEEPDAPRWNRPLSPRPSH